MEIQAKDLLGPRAPVGQMILAGALKKLRAWCEARGLELDDLLPGELERHADCNE